MADTVILRFRDFEADTATLHVQCIEATGATWWAWWKKDSEESQGPELRALTAHGAIDIGLINRQRNTRYVARCERVVATDGGERISSPEPVRTPAYYRDDAFPAWFLLSRIRRVTDPEWNRRFGGVPEGESTIFIVPIDSPDVARDALYDKYSLSSVEVATPTILHISDLHFGSGHGFPLRPRLVPTREETLDEAIFAGLKSANLDRIGLVIVSGDITTEGEYEGFIEAKRFLFALIERLGLSREQLVIVPGNHDILLGGPTATRSYEAETPFRDFLHLIYNQESLDLNRLSWFTSRDDGQEILVLALNSVRPREVSTMQYGYVGRDSYQPLLDKAQSIRDEVRSQNGQTPLMLAVLHHHVLPTPLVEDPKVNRPVSLTLDAGQLIEDLQAARFDVILHGHQHVPFVGSTSRGVREGDAWKVGRPIHVIGGGSCGVNASRLWPNMRNNSVALYRRHDRTLDVRMFEFAPTVPLREYMKLDLLLS